MHSISHGSYCITGLAQTFSQIFMRIMEKRIKPQLALSGVMSLCITRLSVTQIQLSLLWAVKDNIGA